MNDIAQTVLSDIVENDQAAEQVVFDLASWVGWPVLTIFIVIGIVSVINKIMRRK